MNHTINIMTGDWSDDGHGQTDTTIIKTNFEKDQIDEAYKQGVLIVGVDLKRNIACEYEDDLINKEDIAKLKLHGIEIDFEAYDDVGMRMDTDDFTEIFLKVCQLGNPQFRYEIVFVPQVHIGGYGLFYS